MRGYVDPGQPIRRVGRDQQTEEYPPNDLSAENAERAIVAEPVEWLYVFDAGGRQIARFRGTADEVSVSDELARRSGPYGLYGDPVLKDCQIVHNHPPESEVASFPVSRADLLFAVTHDLSRFVVVAGAYRYELGRPAGGWPFDELELPEILREYAATDARSREDLPDSVAANVERLRSILQRMSQGGLIVYAQREITNHD